MEPFISLDNAKILCKKIAQKAWRKLKKNPYIIENNYILGRTPKIQWKKIGFSYAGFAYGGKNIEMNINYLYSKDFFQFINQIVRHELAHIAEYRIFGKTTHGTRWKKFSLLLGYTGTRCHHLSDPINKPVRKLYCINCGEIKLKKILFKQDFYTCPLCQKEAVEKENNN